MAGIFISLRSFLFFCRKGEVFCKVKNPVRKGSVFESIDFVPPFRNGIVFFHRLFYAASFFLFFRDAAFEEMQCI